MEKTNSKLKTTGINNFILENEIGHGSSGVCYKAISKVDGRVCVIKKISINSIKGNSFKLALKEVEVLKNVNHPNIVKFYDSFADDSHMYIVMEYAQKGDLYTVIESFMQMLKKRKIKEQFYSEEEVWEMGRQLLEGLQYLHGKNIVHRDVKTLNIFIGENNNLLIGDLGVSKIIKNDMGLYSRVGTPLYLAPEIIKYEKYDFKADIWGLGCVMYIIASLSHPFEGKNIITLGQSIMTTDPKPIEFYSNKLNSMIKSLLEKNSVKRPEAKFILTEYYSEEIFKTKSSSNKKGAEEKKKSKTDTSEKEMSTKSFMESDKITQTNKLHFRKSFDLKIEIEAKENKNEKLLTVASERQQNVDETIGVEPSVIKLDSHQEKKKLRDLFSFTRLQKSFSNDKKVEKIEASTSIIEQAEIFQIPQERKSFTESNEELKQEVRLDNFVRVRNVQSAKVRNSIDYQYGFEKRESNNFVRRSVNNILFESSKDERLTNTQLRPKSGIGKRMMASNNDIKYIKKRAANESLFTPMTKTFILKKPEMVII